jgi:transcriptional regulator with XRE-family HTH domain
MALRTDGSRRGAGLKLGAAVRRFRIAQGLTQSALEAKIFKSDGTISDIELGKTLRPDAEVLASIEQTLELPGYTLMDFLELLPGWFRPWLDEERRATVLRSFELAIVPGLLQTEAYASALLEDETAVRARMERQQILIRDEPPPPTLRVVLDETVLHRAIGGAKVMHDQLEHLVNSASSRTTIHVVPSAVEPGLQGAFVLATVNGGEVAYVETAVRGMVTSGREDIIRLGDVWESIRSQALPVGMSLDLIRRTAEERYEHE